MNYTSIIRSISNKFLSLTVSPLIRRITKYNHTGEIALCCIAKLENEYIRFFVEYYKNLHFDKIFIYDNNDPDGERFEEVIGDYIQSGFVEIIDFRGRGNALLASYQDFYGRFSQSYDWVAVFDCDEFLTFTDGTNDIHTFLNQSIFKPFQVIHLNWMVFGDNEMLDTDGRNVIDRFKTPILPYDFKTGYLSFPENCHVKSIVRGGLRYFTWTQSPHTPNSNYYLCCNPKGERVGLSSKQEIDFSKAYLRHYSTKTIGEWVKYKIKRGNSIYSKGETSFEAFFRYNKKTEEKLHYVESLMASDN